mmetsp:Transcript_5537/g.13687  ORF Transcript_5537/g.13687 Transcript_5537/m.13687 type:complete len:223 (-) Transcript_5537:158-826(-)
MVQLMALVNGTVRKLQLQGEIALLDRESKQRQKFLGVELYDLIEEQHQALRDEAAKHENPEQLVENCESVLAVFRNVERAISEPLEACRRDVQKLVEGNAPVASFLIQKRKEDFGVAIWPIVSEPQWLHERLMEDTKGENFSLNEKAIGSTMNKMARSLAEGAKTTITKAIGMLSPEERAVESCVERAKKDVATLKAEQDQKEREIDELVSGGTTLECCVGA